MLLRGHSITTWTRWGEGVKKCLVLNLQEIELRLLNIVRLFSFENEENLVVIYFM